MLILFVLQVILILCSRTFNYTYKVSLYDYIFVYLNAINVTIETYTETGEDDKEHEVEDLGADLQKDQKLEGQQNEVDFVLLELKIEHKNDPNNVGYMDNDNVNIDINIDFTIRLAISNVNSSTH